jgi:hypothetical protein
MIMEKVTVYCPVNIYSFRNMTREDYRDLDLGEEYVWEDALAKQPVQYLNDLHSAMQDYGATALNKEPSYIEDWEADKFANLCSHIERVDVSLEGYNNQAWLALCCTADKAFSDTELTLLKEYLAYRLDIDFAELIPQWGEIEHGSDIVTLRLDAVEAIESRCSLPPANYRDLIEANHLLCDGEREPMKQNEATRANVTLHTKDKEISLYAEISASDLSELLGIFIETAVISITENNMHAGDYTMPIQQSFAKDDIPMLLEFYELLNERACDYDSISNIGAVLNFESANGNIQDMADRIRFIKETCEYTVINDVDKPDSPEPDQDGGRVVHYQYVRRNAPYEDISNSEAPQMKI